MEEHKIEPPYYPLQLCAACKQGHVYKTAHEASAHLKSAHFYTNDDLRLPKLAHLKRTHR